MKAHVIMLLAATLAMTTTAMLTPNQLRARQQDADEDSVQRTRSRREPRTAAVIEQRVGLAADSHHTRIQQLRPAL